MTPEEIEELRALVGRLGANAYDKNLAVVLGAALEHIDQQATALDEAEALIKKNAEQINALLAQVAALQEIAEEERACRLSSPDTGAIPTVEHYNALDPEGSILEARRQLSEEHPEAFR